MKTDTTTSEVSTELNTTEISTELDPTITTETDTNTEGYSDEMVHNKTQKVSRKKQITPLSTPPTYLYDKEKNTYVPQKGDVRINLLSHFDTETQEQGKKTKKGGKKTKKRTGKFRKNKNKNRKTKKIVRKNK